MTINQALGQIVKEKIDELNVTMNVFSKQSGLSPAGIYVIINGSSSPTLDTICLLAAAFNMTPGTLITNAQKRAQT
ncbi:MAG: helix-turn-helix transcriptional regulator [Calditrichaeota bacterium]|nr:helix-turn-helix transcriptional regulator [Calditrichota bacterium]